MAFRLALPSLPPWLAWPGQCALCHAWGPHTLCTTCLRDWQRPVCRCARCALPLAPHRPDACADCDVRPPEFDRAVAAVHYAPPWSTLIARLKFQGQTPLAAPLGQLLADAVRAQRLLAAQAGPAADMPWPDVVLPVPLSWHRLQERGYNQSWLLAQACGRSLGLPTRHDVLRRVQHTDRLMGMGAEARSHALRNAFAVRPEQAHWVEGAHVALVDDVLTTGATLEAATRVLQQAGARSVSAWVLARTALRP